MLEDEVDEKYYLSKKAIRFLIRRNKENEKAGRGFGADIQKGEKISSTIDARYGALRNAGESLIYEGAILSEKNKKWLKDGKELSRNFPQGQRVYSSEGIASNICGDAGGLGGKTGLYIIKENKNVLLLDSQKSKVGNRYDSIIRNNTQAHNGNSSQEKEKQRMGDMVKQRIRRLTPKECERLQGFPDDFTKECSDTQRYKQMGNAVSVPVIKAIGKAILNVMHITGE